MNYAHHKIYALMALISGLSISVVAEYFSIVGLVAIFPAAAAECVAMGVVLGVGKIVASVWLKNNWDAPYTTWKIRTYGVAAVVVLMGLTSMGIFGFLSKAHLQQTSPAGDATAKVELINRQIEDEQKRVATATASLDQLNSEVNQLIAKDGTNATKAIAIKRSQTRERTALEDAISRAQTAIDTKMIEREQYAKAIRDIEVEVGPLKYIAAFVYGDTSASLLERTVTWVILLLIVVFDPLALVLLIVSQISFQQMREAKNEVVQPVVVTTVVEPVVPIKETVENVEPPLTVNANAPTTKDYLTAHTELTGPPATETTSAATMSVLRPMSTSTFTNLLVPHLSTIIENYDNEPVADTSNADAHKQLTQEEYAASVKTVRP